MLASGGLAQEGPEPLGEALRTSNAAQRLVWQVAESLTTARQICRNHWETCRHIFDNDIGQTLVVAGKNTDVACGQQTGYVLHLAQKPHRLQQTQLPCKPSHGIVRLLFSSSQE